MKFFLVMIALFAGMAVAGQVDSIGLKKAMQRLDRALLEKDSVALSEVLDKQLSFGHSNGWAQTKKEIWNDFASGKLVYTKIDNRHTDIVAIGKKWASVRTNTAVTGRVGDKEFDLTLHILQVWTKSKKGWQLYARQSAKLN